MEFVNLKPINRICPRCENGNYMRIISGKNVGKLNVKCINCNSYYNYDELLKRDNSKSLNRADGRTMDDLISRAAALDAIDRERKFLVERKQFGAEHVVVHHARRQIEELPAVDAEPVVHAYWIDCSNGNDGTVCRKCSACKDMQIYYRTYYPNFCSECGARMDGEQKEGE